MKKFKISFPKSMADKFADFAFANEVRIVLNWIEGADFFGTDKLICICQVPEDKQAGIEASEWKKFLIAA